MSADPIPLSALQHWCYCPRQWALIHLEQVFEENLHTLRGQALHKRVALTLINREQLKERDFSEREGGAVMLEKGGRKTVLVAYQERKQEPLHHPLLNESIPCGLLPLVQARLLVRAVRGEAEAYLPYLVR